MKKSTFVAEKIDDYPSCGEGRSSWWGKSWDKFYNKYTTEFETFDDWDRDDWSYSADFWDLIPNREGIKIDGLPSWQQGGYPPKCSCGQIKEFIFQWRRFVIALETFASATPATFITLPAASAAKNHCKPNGIVDS